jgi:hypothetical protein
MNEARPLGRVGPTEMLFRLRTIGAATMCGPENETRICGELSMSSGFVPRFAGGGAMRSIDIEPGPVTTGALIDARETLLALVDENTHEFMDSSAAMDAARKPLLDNRIALTRVLRLINKKINGRSPHADGISEAGAAAPAVERAAARQGRQRS